MSLLSLPQSHGLLRRSSAPLGAATMLAGFIVVLGSLGTAAAQTPPPNQLASLKTVPVPEPPNLAEFVTDKAAAIRLGKALFWDMQVGSDGVQACASCHFHAGADHRSTNQLNPRSGAFTSGANHTLVAGDFLFSRAFELCGRFEERLVKMAAEACIQLTEGEVMEGATRLRGREGRRPGRERHEDDELRHRHGGVARAEEDGAKLRLRDERQPERVPIEAQ